ncbi:hypothetical protein [Rhodoblastus sp.]|uniref:hypothetical protein n=1 Tax=Rhodoblastus sp. TaxID=1962975 RepID=UPI003FD74A9A
MRFLFGLGGVASDDFVLVNDGASQEARFSVIVIDDDLQHEGANAVIVTEEGKDQSVRVIEPSSVEFAMSNARQLAHLSRAEIAAGDCGHRLAVGRLHPRRVQISELEDLHGTRRFERFLQDGFAERIAGSPSDDPNSFFLPSRQRIILPFMSRVKRHGVWRPIGVVRRWSFLQNYFSTMPDQRLIAPCRRVSEGGWSGFQRELGSP